MAPPDLLQEATEIRLTLQRGETIPRERLLRFLTLSARAVSSEKRKAEPKLQLLNENEIDFF